MQISEMDYRADVVPDNLYMPKPPNFSLEKAVCSYGFFMTSPNMWINNRPSPSPSPLPEEMDLNVKMKNSVDWVALQRPLRLLDGRSVVVRIYETEHEICISILRPPQLQQLCDDEKGHIVAQVTRMLRLSEAESASVAEFHGLHRQAKEEGFGRLFRSPTLFEDMVKSLLLCNCGWGRTHTMAKALCELNAELRGPPLGYVQSGNKMNRVMSPPQTPKAREVKRKRRSKDGKTLPKDLSLSKHKLCQRFESKVPDIDIEHLFAIEPVKSSDSNKREETAPILGNFPSPEELCELDVNFLSRRCGLGYRGQRIWKLAKDVSNGTIDIRTLEKCSSDEARNMLLQLHGFGPFTCANVLVCMGKYDTIPSDTETVRHIKQEHGRLGCSVSSVSKDVAEVYGSYAPYQFLSYWFELWGSYERKFGKLSSMDASDYGLITGHNMRNKGIA